MFSRRVSLRESCPRFGMGFDKAQFRNISGSKLVVGGHPYAYLSKKLSLLNLAKINMEVK